MINHLFIKQEHLIWAADNGVLISEGQCGLGRPCVGVLKDGHWIEWADTHYDPITFESLPPRYKTWEGYVPPDAYHKHPCIAVLGQTDQAWVQLSVWLDAIIEAKCTVAIYNNNKTGLDAIISGTHIPYLKINSYEESVEL